MKVLTKMFVLCAGLAILWCGTGAARADWVGTTTPWTGYPTHNANGGNGQADTVANGKSYMVSSSETCAASGPYAKGSPEYTMKTDILYTWNTMGPPSMLKLTFTAQASASFLHGNSSNGSAQASASTSISRVAQAAELTFGGSSQSPPASETVTFSNANFTQNFSVEVTSSATGYVYSGTDGSFSTSSSSSMSFSP